MTVALKSRVSGSSQSAKKHKQMTGLSTMNATTFVGIEPLQNVRDAVIAAVKHNFRPTQPQHIKSASATKKSSSITAQPQKTGRASLKGHSITAMTKKEAHDIIMPHVICNVARREPLSRLTDFSSRRHSFQTILPSKCISP